MSKLNKMKKITLKYSECLQYRLLLVMQYRLQELPLNHTVVQITDKIMNRNPYTIPAMPVEAT